MALVFEETFAGANAAAVLAEIAFNGGISNLAEGDVDIGGGPTGGNAVNMVSGKTLSYPCTDNFNFGKGAMQFWVKLNWDPTNGPFNSMVLEQVNAGGTVFHVADTSIFVVDDSIGIPLDNGTNLFTHVNSIDVGASTVTVHDGVTAGRYCAAGSYVFVNYSLFSAGWNATNGVELYLYDSLLSYMRPYFVPLTLFPSSILPSGGLSGWKINEWGLFEIYWDFDSASNNFILWKFNDIYANLTSCPHIGSSAISGTPNMTIGYGASTSAKRPVNGLIGSVKIYDDPADLLPVALNAFPGPTTTISGDQDGGTTTLVVASTALLVANKAVQIPLDVGYHATTIASVTNDTTVELTDALPALPRHVHNGATITTRAYNPLIAQTETNIRALFPDGDGFCSDWETNATNPTDCPLLAAGGDDIRWFKKGQLENVYPGYVPTAGDEAGPFTWRGAKGQVEPIFFNIYSRNALTGVQISVGDFTGPGTITNVDNLRLVKNWWQGSADGGYALNTIPTYVGELLIQDSSVALETDPTLGSTKAPTLPLLDHVTMPTFAAATSRQFVLAVSIPADAVAGDYTATITLIADGPISETKDITLTVLPFALQDYSYERSVWLWPEFDDGIIVGHSLDKWDVFQKHLDAIKAAGYTMINLGCYNWAAAGTTHVYADIIDHVIPLVAATGLKLRVYAVAGVWTDPAAFFTGLTTRYTTALVDAMVAAGLEPWLFGFDEFDHTSGYTAERIAQNLKFQTGAAKHIHSLGTTIKGKCFTSAESSSTLATYTSNLATYNAANYSYAGEPAGDASIDALDYNQSQRNFTKQPPSTARATSGVEGYYFQTRDGLVRWYRYMVGLQSYTSEGIRSGPSQFHAESVHAWNEFITSSDARAYGVVYPSIVGAGATDFSLIPCYNYYAHMEGIKDNKYLATWNYYYNRVKTSHPIEAAASKVVYDAHIVLYTDSLGTGAKPGDRRTFAQWDSDRETIIDEIVTLNALDPSHHRSVISGVITSMWKRFRKIGGVTQ